MALKLVFPGTRKGNKFFLVRGSVNGKVHEYTTGTDDPKLARRIARQLEAKIKAEIPGDRITFAEAAKRYVEFRNPSHADCLRIGRLVSNLGGRQLSTIRPGDLHEIAMQMQGDNSAAATRNREVLRPAVTVLHYAANAGLCDWIRVKAFPEPKPRTRALAPEAAAALIAAADSKPRRLLLTWLFFQGTRITATLKLDWSQIDLDHKMVRMWNAKGQRFEYFPLHDATLAALLHDPNRAAAGSIFPWSSRSSLRRWLPALAARVGVAFTAHMARHTLGTQLAASGASLATIMKALGHSQASSSLRYQSPDIEVVRAATAKISYRRKT